MKEGTLLRQQELIDTISSLVTRDGEHMTPIRGLMINRLSTIGMPVCSAFKASFGLVAQGMKEVVLGDETYRYGGSDFLLTSLDLPVTSRVVDATTDQPYLSIGFEIDFGKLASLIQTLGPASPNAEVSERGMVVTQVTEDLIDAVIRLLRLLDRPNDIPVLAPLIEQEILFRLLSGPQGARLRQMAMADSQSHQISKACAWLKEYYALPLRIEELANRVSMSVSSLHHHFKAVTAMSPMQYQKRLRLQEARRLMLEEMLDAGSAGHQVGYDSQSQFSREYARQYGEPPLRDVGRARRSLLDRFTGNGELMTEG
ncbi:AraC-like DNA-binding protein [Pararhizobium capsulatum DSM 1112]|uniref:AraC-like DNA-binding protein n=1 Tax=Pararhizobium capsulatum DSM 1112 TaxID=1121113 RepID=A0ABU0BTS5_9HYPH|nr:AraC family transcriptional regulator [Pararhizobium capsulatum]MDQ0321663.1 AraC-like DNA-binding protein [Pararhizobium capsulatum DSM 1112]